MKNSPAKDLILTYKCNSNCIFCSTLLDNVKVNEIQTGDIIQSINDMDSETQTIILTGGEPTIRKDFFYVLKKVREKFPKATIEISTNGRMFSYKNFVEKLIEYKDNLIVRVSYPASESKLYSELTNTNGLKQVNMGIRNLLKYGFTVDLIVVINKLNYKKLEDITSYIAKNFQGINKVYFRNLELIRKAFLKRNELALKYTEIMPYLEKAIPSLLDKGIKVELLNFPLCIANVDGVLIRKASRPYEVAFPVCEKCSRIDDCPGIEKAYSAFFGLEEFKPVLLKNIDGKKLAEQAIDYPKFDLTPRDCNLCNKCSEICPTDAISFEPEIKIDKEKCIYCYACTDVCAEI